MTDPADLLADTLRQALSETAGAVTPGADGLQKIRGKIGGRPPRPPLLSFLASGAERVRYFTWRGHWAWSWPTLAGTGAGARPGARPARGVHRRRRPGSDWSLGGLRLASVLGGIVLIASLSFGVQPFRHAIMQASSNVLDGHSPTGSGGGGADGSGSQAPGQGSGRASVGGGGQPIGATGSGLPRASASGRASTCAQPSGNGKTAVPGKTARATGSTPPAAKATGHRPSTTPQACVQASPTPTPSPSSTPAPSPTETFPADTTTPTDGSTDGGWSGSAPATPTDGSTDGGGGNGGNGGGGNWSSDSSQPSPYWSNTWNGSGWYPGQ